MLSSRPLDVLDTLAPVRRGLGLARLERWALRGLTGGAATGVILLMLAHLWAWAAPGTWTPDALRSTAPEVALGCTVAGALAGLVYGLLRWPAPVEAARVADRHFALQDRLTTALEFAGSNEPIPVLQRDEAADRLRGLRLAESVRRHIDWPDWALPICAVAVLAALLLLSFPAPQQGAGAATSDQERIRQAAKATLPALLRHVETRLNPQSQEDPALRNLDQALAKLQRQLLHTSNRSAALRAISTAQQQIQRSAAALHPINSGAVASLSHSLSAYMTSGQRTGRGDSSATVTAQTLNRLAASLNHLSAAQRSRLARSLNQAAAASTDRGLRTSLHSAASSLARQDAQAAASALQQASSALRSTSQTQGAQSKLNAANSQLDLLKNTIAGMTGGQTGGIMQNAVSQPGSGAGKGSATSSQHAQAGAPQSILRSHGLAPNSALKHGGLNGGPGDPIPPNTRNLNRNIAARRSLMDSPVYNLRPGQGQGANAGAHGQPGNGGLAGNGSGGQSRAGLRGPGQFITVFVPGKLGASGQQIVKNTNENSGLVGGHIVPYKVVVNRYTRSVHSTLARTALPPALESYVRRYFSAVSR